MAGKQGPVSGEIAPKPQRAVDLCTCGLSRLAHMTTDDEGLLVVDHAFMPHPQPRLERKLDACESCRGMSGGESGNENVVGGVVLCDDCSCRAHFVVRPSRNRPGSLSVRPLGHETQSVQERLVECGFREGDVVKLVLVRRG